MCIRDSYYVTYSRPRGGRSRQKIGEVGILPLPKARKAAREFLAKVQLGEDPADARPTIVEWLVDSGLVDSNKAARRAIGEGGAYVNNVKIDDDGWMPAEADLLHRRWLVLRRGKKSFAGARFGLR